MSIFSALFSDPTPPTPVPAANVAGTQQTYNTQAAQANQLGSEGSQENVYGKQSFQQSGTGPNGMPLYTTSVTLSPDQQALYNQYTGTQKTAGQQAGNLLQNANYGSTSPADAIGNSTKGLTQTAMNQELAYLNPFMKTQTDQLDTQLKNQGFAPGQPGYDNAMRALVGNQFQNLTGFEAAIEPQMFNQASSLYQMPLTMSHQLAQWGAPQTPNSSFVGTPGFNEQPANYQGAVANEEQINEQNYQSQMQQQNAAWQGLGQIVGGLGGGWASGGGLSRLMGTRPT